MMQQKIYNLLGLMARARKIDVGTEKILEGLKKHKYYLVLLAEDASEATKERFIRVAERHETKILQIGTKDSLADAIGKEITVAIGLSDKGFSKKLEQLITEKEKND